MLRALALMAVAAPAAARAEPCVLTVMGETEGPWRMAAEDARERLARLGDPHDCAAVRLMRDDLGPGATLLFVTRSGREAARRVLEPRELASTLEALLVTLAPPAAPSRTGAPAVPPPRTPRPQGDLDASEPRPLPASQRLALLVGARLASVSGAYLGPSFRLEGASALGSWELVASLESAPTHLALTAVPAGYALATHTLGFAVLRRHDFEAFLLAYGASAGLAVLAMSADPIPGGIVAERSLEKWQPRLGAIGAMSVPLGETLTFRSALHVDGAVANFSDPGAAARGLPPFPRLGTTLFVGLETALR